jgi:hypothetical protein
MAIVILYQFCLVLGLPWGEASMGGRFPGKYPPKMRLVAIMNMLILSCLVVIVLVYADIWLMQFKSLANIGIWFVLVFSVIAVILNTITPSKIERKIWAPVTIIQLIACIIVTFN